MADIIKGISNLFASVFQIIEGTISTIVSTITTAISTVVEVVIGLFKNLFNLAEGVVGLILGNLVLILLAIGGYFIYVNFVQRQGGQPISDKIAKKTK